MIRHYSPENGSLVGLQGYKRAVLLLAVWLTALLTAPVGQADWRHEIIYFVMVDRFADSDRHPAYGIDPSDPLAFHGGDLRGLTENLDEIQDLGATAIWITPVAAQVRQPVAVQEGLFHGHHGYWADTLAGVDPRFGSERDLKRLADELHVRGMKLMLDVVYNHVGPKSSMLTDPSRLNWLRTDDECGGDPVTACIFDLPDFKTENPHVAAYVIQTQLALAQAIGADGFRLDTVKHIDTAFWQQHRREVLAQLGEDFYLLGEVWDADKYLAAPYFSGDLMDGIIDFGFRNTVYDYLRGVTTADRLGRYLAKRHMVKPGHDLAPFLSNHDMPMLLAQLQGDTDRLEIGLTLLMTASGPPILAWGEEVGRQGGVWPNNRQDMPWGEREVHPGTGMPRDEALRDFVKALIAWRKSHPDIADGPQATLYSDGDVLVFPKGACTVVGVNRAEAPRDPPQLGLGAPVISTMLGAETLPPKSARVWNGCPSNL